MLIIEQIFQYQVIRDTYLFYFTNKKEQMRNESKKNKFVFNVFFFKTKKNVRL